MRNTPIDSEQTLIRTKGTSTFYECDKLAWEENISNRKPSHWCNIPQLVCAKSKSLENYMNVSAPITWNQATGGTSSFQGNSSDYDIVPFPYLWYQQFEVTLTVWQHNVLVGTHMLIKALVWNRRKCTHYRVELTLWYKHGADWRSSNQPKQNLCFCITASNGYYVFDVLGGFSLGCFDP